MEQKKINAADLSPFMQQVTKDAEKAVAFTCALVNKLKTLPPPTTLYINGVEWAHNRRASYVKLLFGWTGKVHLKVRRTDYDADELSNLSTETAIDIARTRLLRMSVDNPIKDFNWDQLRRAALDDIQSAADYCETLDQALQKTTPPTKISAFKSYSDSITRGCWDLEWGTGEQRLELTVHACRQLILKFPGSDKLFLWNANEAVELISLHLQQNRYEPPPLSD